MNPRRCCATRWRAWARTLAAQGLGSATPGAPLGTLGSVNFNTPGGTTNCNSLTLLRTGAADLERNFAALAANSSTFRLEYPEDIKLVGASMSTTLGSTGVPGRGDLPA